jgi:hypothetical protein
VLGFEGADMYKDSVATAIPDNSADAFGIIPIS